MAVSVNHQNLFFQSAYGRWAKQVSMQRRYVSIWFPHLTCNWLTIRKPALKNVPFVLTAPDHGRLLVTASSPVAQSQGIHAGTAVADARALVPALEVFDDRPGLAQKLLTGLAEWCIRYTPITAIDLPHGLILDSSGCAHLWGGEMPYLKEIINRLQSLGYEVHASMAGTVGLAWALARFGKNRISIEENGNEVNALIDLPPAALRIDQTVLDKMLKLGFYTVGSFVNLPRQALRRRFGKDFLLRIDQIIGLEEEIIHPLVPLESYQERLPCLEPISTAIGIEIALKQLLEAICQRLKQEGKGLRSAVFKGYRVDGKIEQIEIGTNRASVNIAHLFKLFELKICNIEPALGIELFTLDAPIVEEAPPSQEMLWGGVGGLEDASVSELIDRITGKVGVDTVTRYLPAEHYWPERSFKKTTSLGEKTEAEWRLDRPRPVQLLANPELIEVAAPIPDYPPMHFQYKGKLHKIKKADGPERIEREWWLEEGEHRDYYTVEDEDGCRYWLFRAGHYTGDKSHSWFIHGFFA
jgi:protein ImuB